MTTPAVHPNRAADIPAQYDTVVLRRAFADEDVDLSAEEAGIDLTGVDHVHVDDECQLSPMVCGRDHAECQGADPA